MRAVGVPVMGGRSNQCQKMPASGAPPLVGRAGGRLSDYYQLEAAVTTMPLAVHLWYCVLLETSEMTNVYRALPLSLTFLLDCASFADHFGHIMNIISTWVSRVRAFGFTF